MVLLEIGTYLMNFDDIMICIEPRGDYVSQQTGKKENCVLKGKIGI